MYKLKVDITLFDVIKMVKVVFDEND